MQEILALAIVGLVVVNILWRYWRQRHQAIRSSCGTCSPCSQCRSTGKSCGS